MAKETETTQQAQTTQPQARPCPQDCRHCSINQQVFCSVKMLFDLSRQQQAMQQQIAELQARLPKPEGSGELAIPFSE